MFDKDIIQMSSLGKMGRLGNEIFQYAFLKIYAKMNNLEVQVPDWEGRILFNQKSDAYIEKEFPKFIEDTSILKLAKIPKLDTPLKNVDIQGFFQYHTSYYRPYKDYFRSLFQPFPSLEIELNNILVKIRKQGNIIVAIHIRQTDFGWGTFWTTPIDWYLNFLEGLWETLDKPVLIIATDNPSVSQEFIKYRPINIKSFCSKSDYYQKIGYYIDFWLLTQADILAISNSSYSFSASMLNKRAFSFNRPHFRTKKFIPYDPWNSEVRFRGTIAPTAFQEILNSKINITSKEIWIELQKKGYLDQDGKLTSKFKNNQEAPLILASKFHFLESQIRTLLEQIIIRFNKEV